jgi:hypothetical protein
MPSPLDNLVTSDALRREPPDAREYEGLLRSGRVRLTDAQRPSNGLESRFELAYRVLAKAHRVRIEGEYEGNLNLSERLVTDLVTASPTVVAALDALSPPG